MLLARARRRGRRRRVPPPPSSIAASQAEEYKEPALGRLRPGSPRTCARPTRRTPPRTAACTRPTRARMCSTATTARPTRSTPHGISRPRRSRRRSSQSPVRRQAASTGATPASARPGCWRCSASRPDRRLPLAGRRRRHGVSVATQLSQAEESTRDGHLKGGGAAQRRPPSAFSPRASMRRSRSAAASAFCSAFTGVCPEPPSAATARLEAAHRIRPHRVAGPEGGENAST